MKGPDIFTLELFSVSALVHCVSTFCVTVQTVFMFLAQAVMNGSVDTKLYDV